MKATKITVETTVKAPVEKVWEYYTTPGHILKWNSASDDWHTTKAENDLRVGGKFVSRMEAKDGSLGFDFEGVYDNVKTNERIAYTMTDGRKAEITFMDLHDETKMTVVFDAEGENPIEIQREGWQAILDSFTKYVETN
ncbi:SRPBCC family protein [Olivibacter domesticus]|uniref:Uncharacterized conserved protein YndB, AHSA1/START domain n=1 Tax=Olivibacter domesticus TaxID=407022 RepID=A0A1H7KSW8_OLID1|nr:SRPBCC family protein [Olivibacter domesticus]SEK89630.1 Uncharacterized conserved protein YndB, AHSA1/START domain [Olivibacter domesticus]